MLSVVNECRQTLVIVQQKKKSGFTSSVVMYMVTCRWGVHVDGSRCKRCDGTIPEANIAENLVVDGETYWCVNSFCFVWDTVDGAHLAATPRIRIG